MNLNWLNEKNSSVNWHEQVYNDSDLWDYNSSKYLPRITANEYERLRELFRQGQTYGAFLQIKDVLELIIKVPVIVAVAQAVNKSCLDKKDEFYEVIYNMLKEPLSFGQWRSIAGLILKVGQRDNNIQIILRDIYNVCLQDDPVEGHVDVVKWRNSRIGHGALMFDESELFKDEMILLLKLIKKHFNRSAALYSQIEIVARGRVKSSFLADEQVPLLDMMVFAKVADSDYFSLSPFMEIIGNKIYCFDTYLRDKKKVDMLDYAEASKIKRSIKFLDDLFEDMCRNKNIKNLGKGFIGRTYFTDEEKLFLSNSQEDKYIKPEYLFELLGCALKENKSGVYFLKMSSGMGKTTFIKMLDNHSPRKYKKNLEDFSVRAYYINSAYSSDTKKFIFDIQDCLRKDDNGRSISGEGRFFNDKKSFAEMLNYYRAEYASLSVERGGVKPNLVVIIDGLDEAVAVEGNSIIDFIPNPDMLDEGVHILLSSRTNEELPASILSKLLEIKTTSNYVISKEDSRNRAMVNEYIHKILGITDFDTVALMNEIIDQKLLRANLLRYMPEIIDRYNFLDSQEVCKVFLDKLNFIYSEKYFVRVRKVLLILAMSEVPLSVHQVSKIMKDAKVDFQLLGIFYDIGPLVEKVETDSGACFTIAHQSFRKLIFEYFEADGEKLQLELLQTANELIAAVETLELEEYLTIYYAYLFTEKMLPDLMEYIQIDKFLYNTAMKLKQNIRETSDFYQNYIISEICKKISLILNQSSIRCVGDCYDTGITRLICYYNIAVTFYNTRNYTMAGPMFTDVVDAVKSGHYTDNISAELSEQAREYLTIIPDVSFKEEERVEESEHVEREKKQAINYEKAGRNDTCPCGSGKKFKKCCMLTGTLQAASAPVESELDSMLGLNICISQHDVFDGAREFVLAVFDSTIQYIEEKENVDVKMLVRLFSTVKYLLLNGYHCNKKPIAISIEEFYKLVSYDAITNFLGDCYQLKTSYRSQIANSFRSKDFEREFANCERLCLIGFINSFLLGQNYDEQVSIGMNLNDAQSEITTYSVFNRAWKNDLILLYRLIKSRKLSDYQGVISVKIFGSQRRNVLGWRIKCIADDIPQPVSSTPRLRYIGSWWKQTKYDYNQNYLSNLFGLKEVTIDALKVLTDNISIYHEYCGNVLEEINLVEKKGELFPAVIANYHTISNVFSAIEVEYMELAGLLSGRQMDHADQAYEYLLKPEKIAEKHRKVLCEFRLLKKGFSQSSIINDVVSNLQEIMFAKKLALYTSDFVRREKIRKNVAGICEMTSNQRATREVLRIVKPTYADIEIQLNR